MWLGQHTILPERERRNTRRPIKRPKDVQRAARDEDNRERDEEDGGGGGEEGLGVDVGRLGGAVEKAEEEQGREGSLAASTLR